MSENKVNEHLSITVNGAEREIVMSFGLLSELANLVGDPGRVAAIPIDPELRDQTLKAVLAERTVTGKVKTPVEDVLDVEISIDDAEKILDWVMENVINFFIRSLRRVAKVTKANQKEMDDLASSLVGSPS